MGSPPTPEDPGSVSGAPHLPAGFTDGYEFAIQGGKPLPDEGLRYYFGVFSDPDVLRGGFGFYRAWNATLAQNERRKRRRLTMPVLAALTAFLAPHRTDRPRRTTPGRMLPGTS